MRRLTILLPDDIYRDTKVACAIDGVSVTSAVAAILKREFGARADLPQRDRYGQFRKRSEPPRREQEHA